MLLISFATFYCNFCVNEFICSSMKSKSSCHIFCSCELSSLWNSVCSIVSFNLHNGTKKWILAKIDANWNPMEGSCFWYLIFIRFWWKEFTISYNYLTKNGKNFTISYDYLTKSLHFPFRGIEPSSSAVDIKKAYRKAALRHHPDKVLCSFPSNYNSHSSLV